MTHPHFGHETATYLMQTGRNPGGGDVYPAIGAVIAMMKEKEYRGDLPPFVILTTAKGRFSEVGFLGSAAAPLVTGGNPTAAQFVVDGIVPPGGLTKAQIQDRFDRCHRLDRLPFDPEFEAAGAAARQIILGRAAETFDLSREKPAVRKRYGTTTGGGYTEICSAVKNMIANLTGMICDGAKPSCSLKLSSGASTAVLSAMLAMQGNLEGIIDNDVDKSIHNLTSIGREAMRETNRMVLDIMVKK